jgi:hypothetical protein
MNSFKNTICACQDADSGTLVIRDNIMLDFLHTIQ